MQVQTKVDVIIEAEVDIELELDDDTPLEEMEAAIVETAYEQVVATGLGKVNSVTTTLFGILQGKDGEPWSTITYGDSGKTYKTWGGEEDDKR